MKYVTSVSKLIFVFVLTFLFFSSSIQRINAANDCSSYVITPQNGDTTTSFSFLAQNCINGLPYMAYVEDANGNHPWVFGDVGDQRAGNGYWPANIGVLPEGTYTFHFRAVGTFTDLYTTSIVVSPADVPNMAWCGDKVTSSTACPSNPQCPRKQRTDSGEYWCSCGDLDQGACPSGNAFGLAPCLSGLKAVPDESGNNICRNDLSGTSVSYSCGEMVFPEDSSNFSCINCNKEILSPPGPSGEQYWCACGNEGGSCCPVGAADISQLNCGSGSDGCNLKPGLKQCNDPSLTCDKNTKTCLVPITNTFSPVFCNDQASVITAIGCVPINTIERFSAFFITWGLGVGGGFSILVFIAAAFTFITSSGDPTKLNQAKELVMSAITGVLFLVFSIFLLRIIGVNVLGLF